MVAFTALNKACYWLYIIMQFVFFFLFCSNNRRCSTTGYFSWVQNWYNMCVCSYFYHRFPWKFIWVVRCVKEVFLYQRHELVYRQHGRCRSDVDVYNHAGSGEFHSWGSFLDSRNIGKRDLQAGVLLYPSFNSGNCVHDDVHFLRSILRHILSTEREDLPQAKNIVSHNLDSIFSADGPISYVVPNRVWSSSGEAFLFTRVAMARQERCFKCWNLSRT